MGGRAGRLGELFSALANDADAFEGGEGAFDAGGDEVKPVVEGKEGIAVLGGELIFGFGGERWIAAQPSVFQKPGRIADIGKPVALVALGLQEIEDIQQEFCLAPLREIGRRNQRLNLLPCAHKVLHLDSISHFEEGEVEGAGEVAVEVAGAVAGEVGCGGEVAREVEGAREVAVEVAVDEMVETE